MRKFVCVAAGFSTVVTRLRLPLRNLLSLVASFVLSMTGTNAWAGYLATQLPSLGGTSSIAYGMNNVGQVVGMASTVDGAWHPALWSGGAVTDLTVPGTFFEPRGINDAGQVVGIHDGFRVAIWDGGALTDLGFQSVFPRINNVGQVLGDAMVWSAGVITDLGTLGGSTRVATGINDGGQVVGFSSTAGDADRHATLWSGGSITDLGTLGGWCSEAWAINNAGQVVGGACTAGNSFHAVLWSNGTETDLSASGVIGAYSVARDINEAGQIVGFALPERAHAALWSGGVATDLNELLTLDLRLAGWVLDDAPPGFIGINDQGWIVANGFNDSPGPNVGPVRGTFLFRPDGTSGGLLPEPGAVALSMLAFAAATGATRAARSIRRLPAKAV